MSTEVKMKRSLYIHIGPAKTGTSAIQKFLCLNEEKLSKKGVHYLKTFRREGMHHPLAWMLLQRHSKDYTNIHGKAFSGQFENFCTQLASELNTITDKSIIISSEVIASLNKKAIDELLCLFPKIEVKIIFYVRDLYSQSLSLISQIVKWKDTTNDNSISTAYGHLKYFYEYYVGCLKLWEEKIGADNIIFRKFGKEYFKSGNIYTDFLCAIELDCTDNFILPSKLTNESLRYCETIYFKDILNKLNLNTPQNLIVQKLLLWEKKNQGQKFYFEEDVSKRVNKSIEGLHKYLLEKYLDTSFEEVLNKDGFATDRSDFSLSYGDFEKMLDFMDEQIDEFKIDFQRALIKTLNRTSDYGQKTQKFKEALKNLIDKENSVVLWGCGSVAEKLFREYNFLKRAKFYIVDKNNEKQGTDFWGHKVMPPKAIEEKGIDTVIITSMAYANEICDEIKSQYPNVRKIIKLLGFGTEIGIECINC
jgi:hypothetical protein